MVETFYDILQVSRVASPEVIRAAYKSLSQRWHPDRNLGNRAEAECRMKGINAAYDVLSDPQKRATYDAKLDVEAETKSNPQQQQANPESPPRQSPVGANSDGGFWGGFASGYRGGGARPAPPSADDLAQQPVPAWVGLLIAVGMFVLIFVAMTLWGRGSTIGKLAAITIGGAIPAGVIAYYFARRWQKVRRDEDGHSALAAKELSWLMTAVAWAWVPFVFGMEWRSGSSLPVKLSYFAVLLAAWIPAYGIAKAIFSQPSTPFSLSLKKVYGLLLLMCVIQIISYFLFHPIGQRGWIQILENTPSNAYGYSSAAAQLAGAVIGAAFISALYALLLFAIGASISYALVSSLRAISVVRVEMNIVALTAGWALIPLLAFAGVLWGIFHPGNASEAPPQAQIVDPFERELAVRIPQGYQLLEGQLDQVPGYTWLNVKDRVQIEIPSNWTVGSEQYKEGIKQWSEAISGLVGQHKAALSVQSYPIPSRNFVRVSFLPLQPPVSQQEIRDEVATNRQQAINDFSGSWTEGAPAMWAGLAKAGVSQVGQPTFGVEPLGGQTALVIRYGRTVPGNPAVAMRVEQYHVALGAEKALITLSYVDRDSAAVAAYQRIKSSIVIQ